MIKANKDLVAFIKEARRRGFSDLEIKEPLIKKGWAPVEVAKAFSSLSSIPNYKNKICFYLDADVLKIIQKRAKKNLLTVEEQVEDIVRRSAVNGKLMKKTEGKIDDLLVSIFSRKRTGKPNSNV